MAQPRAYNRTKDFTSNFSDETDHTALNAEFDSASNSINDIRTNIALIQSDDGSLKRGIFTIENFTLQAYEALIDDVVSDVTPTLNAIDERAGSAEQAASSAAGSAADAADSADAAAGTAGSALSASEVAVSTAQSALAASQEAGQQAALAIQSAEAANTAAESAVSTADGAASDAADALEAVSNLNQQVADAVDEAVPDAVAQALTEADIPQQVEDKVHEVLLNTPVPGLSADSIEATLGYTPADNADLQAEIEARQDADDALQDNLDTEAQTRQDADDALETAITGVGNSIPPVESTQDSGTVAVEQNRLVTVTGTQSALTLSGLPSGGLMRETAIFFSASAGWTLTLGSSGYKVVNKTMVGIAGDFVAVIFGKAVAIGRMESP